MPNIIMLMGVSSSGKTSVANEIKRQASKASEEYLLVGFDHAVESLDKKYWPGGSNEKEGFYYEMVKSDKGEFPELRHGSEGAKFLQAMMSDIIAKANSGKNLIIDFVMSDEEHAALVAGCKDCKIISIGIKPPLDEVIRREKARGDRKEGIAEAAYETFYQGKTFDLLLDTMELTSSKAAEQILNILNSPKNRLSPR